MRPLNKFPIVDLSGYEGCFSFSHRFIAWATILFGTLGGSSASFAQTGLDLNQFRTPEVLRWVENENFHTQSFLDRHPLKDQIFERPLRIRASNAPIRFHFGSYELSLNGSSLTQISADGSQKILVGPTELQQNHEITEFRVSPNGQVIAFAMNALGSDVAYWKFYDLQAQKILPDEGIRVRFLDVSWNEDSTGFYYVQWPDEKVEEDLRVAGAHRNLPVAFHRLGTPSNEDHVIFPSPENWQSALWKIEEVIPGKVLLANRSSAWNDWQLWSYIGRREASGTFSWKPLILPGKSHGRYFAKIAGKFIYRTNDCGGEACLVSINPLTGRKQIVLPSRRGEVMRMPYLVGNKALVPILDGRLRETLRIYDPSGSGKEGSGRSRYWKMIAEVTPEKLGLDPSGTFSATDPGMSYWMASHPLAQKLYFTYSAPSLPTVTIVFDATKNRFEVLPSRPNSFDGIKNIRTDLHFAKSYDGAMIPVYLIYRTDLKKRPKYIFEYAYGAGGLMTKPSFSGRYLSHLEIGGIVAIVGIRGGGEYGMKWTLAGIKDSQMTSARDMVAGARWLRRAKLTQGLPIVLSGASFGGLNTYLAYAHFTEEFDAFIPQVPISDIRQRLAYSYIGFPLHDEYGVRRSRSNGELEGREEFYRTSENWAPRGSAARMRTSRPILSMGSQDDLRVGPEQTYLMHNELLKRFGTDAPIYLLSRKAGGHVSSNMTGDALLFIANLFNIQTIDPLVGGN